MSQFVFRFQPVLSLKKQMEDNLKNELGKAVKRFEDEKETLKRFEDNREECFNQMKQHANKGIDVTKLREYNTFVSHLRRNITLQQNSVREAEENVQNRRKDLIQAVKERETLDKLKEKKHYEFSREQLRNEQKFNDEIAGYAYNKKIAGEKNG